MLGRVPPAHRVLIAPGGAIRIAVDGLARGAYRVPREVTPPTPSVRVSDGFAPWLIGFFDHYVATGEPFEDVRSDEASHR